MVGSIAQEFVELVKQILERAGFASNLIALPADFGADLRGFAASGAEMLVEVKLYRSERVAVGVVTRALQQLRSSLEHVSSARGVLVMTASSGEMLQSLKFAYPDIDILDFDAVRSLASRDIALLARYDEIIRSVSPLPRSNVGLVQASEEPDFADIQLDVTSTATKQSSTASLPLVGASIASRIGGILPGKEQAAIFESEMMAALRYLFEEDIASLITQKSTRDGLSRYDAIGRIASRHDFWQIVSGHFHSRYVIFEFKNYEGEIKQGQIYSTEKYLYANAMRSTAIIISQFGASRNAVTASIGALRESRKLIINITSDQVCRMLRGKDKGNDPNDTLLEIIDSLLMGVSR